MKKQILDFYADWCGPCRYIKPHFEELEQKYPDIEFITINVDELEQTELENYGVTCMPTFLFIVDDEEIDRIEGASIQLLQEKTEYLDSLNPV